MSGPLDGRTIVVTRARSQASALTTRLVGLGATVVELPVIAIEDPDDGGEALRSAADALVGDAYRWLVVTSASTAGRLSRALAGRQPSTGTKVAAVGSATAAALAAEGLTVDLVPDRAVGEALVDAFPPPTDPRPTVLFVRAATVRPVVASGLASKGWQVDEVVAYRTVMPELDPVLVEAARQADGLCLTSSSTVEGSLAALGVNGLPRVVVSIGPVTSAALRASGRPPDAEADPHSVEGVIEALVEVMGRS